MEDSTLKTYLKKGILFLSNPFVVVFAVLFIDQLIKVWVKTTMYLGQSYPVLGNWFYIYFTENRGMAFGWEIPYLSPEIAKLILTVFRIVAVFAIGYYLFKLPLKTPKGLKVGIALIFAGAIGNILDSTFYGVLFSESVNQIAEFLPDGGGYERFLHGKVVDMLYFRAYWPNWMPYLAGKEIFPPIFNVADSAISIGISVIVIFQKKFFKKEEEQEKENTSIVLEQESK